MKNLKYNLCNEWKSMDAVGYILLKEGGEMDYRKLMSLLYMSVRICAQRQFEIYCNASLAITPDGPVLYEILEHLKGNKKSKLKYGWGFKLNKIEGYKVSVKPYVTDYFKHLGHLHEYFRNIMDEVYDEFGHMSHKQLSKYISDNFPECRNFHANKGLKPSLIDLNVLLEDLGYSRRDIKEFEEQMEHREGLAMWDNESDFLDTCNESLEHVVNKDKGITVDEDFEPKHVSNY